MCGLTGFVDLRRGRTADELTATVRRMCNTIVHRGPDDSGEWVDPESGTALGFRRLSIIDLSPAGHQPMTSSTGRFVITFNGEIYNFEAIRAELDHAGLSPKYRGHSDTEVMLAAFEAWGVAESVKRFIGMFAIALWDRQARELHLIRDRLGVKPMYCGWAGKTFVYGSELKTLRAHPDFAGEIDRGALALFMRHAYVPAPHTIYKGIRKLTPGTILTLRSSERGVEEILTTYWSAREVAERGVRNTFRGTDQEAIEELDTLLRDAVGLRMIADVPLGVFLSGGIDSSAVVALMQAQSNRPVRSFSIGFHEEQYNEAQHASAVARHLGTDHTELYVTPADALEIVPRLATMYDEPFADSSQIPTHLVSAMARKHVTVSLSGDGGDELFGGYNRYFVGRDMWKKVGWMPAPIRASIARVITTLSAQSWDDLGRRFQTLIPGMLRQRTGDKMLKVAEIMNVDTPDAMYRGLVSYWKEPSSLVIGSAEADSILTDSGRWATLDDFTDRMMYLDMVSYLPDDILTKVDRASMATSLEAREPLLDHRVVEFAWRLPLGMKIRNGEGKWILRQVLYRYVPKELLERPKMGFGIPIDSWLRGPLRSWADELLNESRLRQEGYLDAAPIRDKWDEHQSGERNWQYYLWNILIFQQWLENERREGRSCPSEVAAAAG